MELFIYLVFGVAWLLRLVVCLRLRCAWAMTTQGEQARCPIPQPARAQAHEEPPRLGAYYRMERGAREIQLSRIMRRVGLREARLC